MAKFYAHTESLGDGRLSTTLWQMEAIQFSPQYRQFLPHFHAEQLVCWFSEYLEQQSYETLSIQLKIFGATAMWTRPNTGSSPVSYVAPTFSAVKGNFESVLRWKTEGAAYQGGDLRSGAIPSLYHQLRRVAPRQRARSNSLSRARHGMELNWR